MKGVKHRARRKPWEVPDCPDCGHGIYVEGSPSNTYDWVCRKCETTFHGDTQ